MKHLLNFISGARRVLVLGDDRDYVRPRNGFLKDAEALRGDVRRVGSGMKESVRRYGEQVDYRKG